MPAAPCTAPHPELITVAHVHDSTLLGGAETTVAGWLRHLDRQRFVPLLFCFEEVNGAERVFIEYLARRHLTPYLMLPWGRQKRLLAAVRRLIPVLRTCQPCIVHTHGWRSDLVGWLAARTVGCPIVASNHGWHSIWSGISRKIYWREKLRAPLLKRFDLLIDVCERTREESLRRGIDAAHVVTVHTGIDLEGIQCPADRDVIRADFGFEPGHLVIGNVARLHPEKGQIHLLHAFASVYRQHPQARLLIVGDGPLAEPLQTEARRLGINQSVIFLGFQDDVARVFAALDVFALPSLAEGAPLVVYLAMAAGLPIVAADIAGVGEVLRHGETAWLIPPGDVAALTEALLRLTMDDPGERHALGRRAQETMAAEPRYSIVTSTRRLEVLYTRLLGR